MGCVSGVTGEPGFCPELTLPGFNMNGVVKGLRQRLPTRRSRRAGAGPHALAARHVGLAGRLELELELAGGRLGAGRAWRPRIAVWRRSCGVMQPAALDVQRVAPGRRSLAEQDALGTPVGDLDRCRDRMRAVEQPRRGEVGDGLGTRAVGVRSRGSATSGFSATIRCRPLPLTGMTPYLPASTYHVPISSMSLSRWSAARSWFLAGSSSMR